MKPTTEQIWAPETLCLQHQASSLADASGTDLEAPACGASKQGFGSWPGMKVRLRRGSAASSPLEPHGPVASGEALVHRPWGNELPQRQKAVWSRQEKSLCGQTPGQARREARPCGPPRHFNAAFLPGFLSPGTLLRLVLSSHLLYLRVQARARISSTRWILAKGPQGEPASLPVRRHPSVLTSETEPFCRSVIGKVSHSKKEKAVVSVCYLGRVQLPSGSQSSWRGNQPSTLGPPSSGLSTVCFMITSLFSGTIWGAPVTLTDETIHSILEYSV